MSQAMTAMLAGIVGLLIFALSRYYSEPITNNGAARNDNYDNPLAPKLLAKYSHFLLFVAIYSAA